MGGVGSTGTILKTTNGGTDWTFQAKDTLPFLNSVYFTDKDNGYAVGYNGSIMKTINGGTLWTLQMSGTTSYFSSVFFTGVNTGYAVGQNGVILKTENGGGYPLEINEKYPISNRIKIYPNPSSDKITIEASKTFSTGHLSILNLNSQEILSQTITKPSTQIDISTFPTGVYFVKLTGEKEVSVGKFIKN